MPKDKETPPRCVDLWSESPEQEMEVRGTTCKTEVKLQKVTRSIWQQDFETKNSTVGNIKKREATALQLFAWQVTQLSLQLRLRDPFLGGQCKGERGSCGVLSTFFTVGSLPGGTIST